MQERIQATRQALEQATYQLESATQQLAEHEAHRTEVEVEDLETRPLEDWALQTATLQTQLEEKLEQMGDLRGKMKRHQSTPSARQNKTNTERSIPGLLCTACNTF